MAKVGVVLLSMGGPDSLEAVEPFLRNLFSDPDIFPMPRLLQKPLAYLIAKVRSKKTRHYYEIMGGKSPQKDQTLQQAKALQEALGENFKVVVAMRYWHPFTHEALQELFKEEISQIVLLPMYPQFSRTTTGSSFNEFFRVYEKSNFPKVRVLKVLSYHDHPLYIEALADLIKNNLPDDDAYILFSAHSLPVKVIEEGDPYKDQTEETVRLVMEKIPGFPYSLSYQSKVGPMKWLEPFTDRKIKELACKGVKNLVLVPISFVSEHSETLYEMDHVYRDLALRAGIEKFIRVPTLRTHPKFIEALKDVVCDIIKC